MNPSGEKSEPSQPRPRKKSKKPFHRRKWPYVLAALLAGWGVCVGPWPVYTSHYDRSDYAEATFARLEALPLETTRGELRAGAATVEITPPVGEPMAGYGARDPMTSDGIAEKLHARAISVSNGSRTVTIAGGDILLVLPELRDAILQRVQLPREEVFFTATHTHSGPGGYASRWADEVVMGPFDPRILQRLAGQFSEAILQSRKNLRRARMTLVQATFGPELAGTFAVNRIDRQTDPHGTVTAVTFRALDGPATAPANGPRADAIATLAVASPHPTCLGHENRRIAGDYPGVVARLLEQVEGGTCLFAAGAVGSTGPAEQVPRGQARAETVGYMVTSALSAIGAVSLPEGPPRAVGNAGASGGAAASPFPSGLETRTQHLRLVTTDQAVLAAGILGVDLPPQQYHVGEYLRFSTILASYLHNRRTYIHVLRINDLVLLGMPCDYSGELAGAIEAEARRLRLDLAPVITSFNGDYIGYLVPHDRYLEPHYETRDMNLFGPWCGEYFNDLSIRALRRLSARPQRPGR